MSAERMQISLEEFLKYLLKKWKLIVVVVALCAGIFTATAAMFGEEIVVPHSEEYLRVEQELEWHISYFEESILMNLNPTNIYQRTLFIRDISDKDLLKDYAISSEIWDDLETEHSKKYISELVQWNENSSDGTVELQLRHATSEECLESAEYLKEKLLTFDVNANIIVGAEKIVKDDDLQEEHVRWYSRIDYMNSVLLEQQAGYTIKVNLFVSALIGALSGGILTISLILIFYLFNNKIRNEDELEAYTGAKIIKDMEMLSGRNDIFIVNLSGDSIEIVNVAVIVNIDAKSIDDRSAVIAVKINETDYKDVKSVVRNLEDNHTNIYGCIVC